MAIDVLKQIWPEWQIGKRIGGGAYGVVYEAIRREYDVENHAAIKIISVPASESEVDTLRSEGLSVEATKTHFQAIVNDFVNEIRLMLSLEGRPNIVNVKDYKVVEKEGEFGWYIFILMELLTPFAVYTCDKKLSEKEVIKLGWDICTALEVCTQEKIIHRDIKLGNILVHKKTGTFKLGDFGIARKLENVTGGLSQRYTPKYMAPEVATSTNYDARVDIYSLGIVMYQLLNGMRIPFQDNKQINTMLDIENAVRRRNTGEALPVPCDASPAMADLILRACAYDPNMRFASATEMKQALVSVVKGTYQMADSAKLDKTTSVRSVPADYDKTTSVRRVPEAINQKSTQPVNTFGNVPKKNKLPKIIATALTITIIIVAGIFVVPKLSNSNSENETNENSSASTSMTAEYSKFDEEQIANIIFEADALAAEGNFEIALTKVNAGLVTYPKSEDLLEKSEEYKVAFNAQVKEKTLREAAIHAEAGDYVSAMALIKNAQDTYGNDADYQNVYDTYNKGHISKVKAEAIEEADNYAQQKDYLGAVETINKAINTIGEDIELTAKAKEYEDYYSAEIVAKVNGYLDVNDFLSAESTLSTALKIFPNNRTLLEEKELVKNVMPQSLLSVCPPYKTDGEFCETWTNLSMGGIKYAAGVSIGGYDVWGDEGFALFNLAGKYTILSFDVGSIDSRRYAENETLHIYLDGNLVWSLSLDPDALPTNYTIDVSGAKQMKIVGSTWAGSFGIANMLITGGGQNEEVISNVDDGSEMLLSVCPPYKTHDEFCELWTNLSMGGVKYTEGISVGGYDVWGDEGFALFNLSGKYTTLSFDVGSIDSRRYTEGEILHIYLDDSLVWSLSLDPDALPTNYVIDVTGAKQMKIVGSTWAGTFGIANCRIR